MGITTHVSSEAMLCKFFCLKFGYSMGGSVYVDENTIIHVTPSVWEIVVSQNCYSCYILETHQIFYFRKNHKEYWGMGLQSPEEFKDFSSTAKDYVGFNYLKPRVLVDV